MIVDLTTVLNIVEVLNQRQANDLQSVAVERERHSKEKIVKIPDRLQVSVSNFGFIVKFWFKYPNPHYDPTYMSSSIGANHNDLWAKSHLSHEFSIFNKTGRFSSLYKLVTKMVKRKQDHLDDMARTAALTEINKIIDLSGHIMEKDVLKEDK